MYTINKLVNNDWEYYTNANTSEQVIGILRTTELENVRTQVLYQEHYISCIDGTVHQIDWLEKCIDLRTDKVMQDFSKYKEKTKVKVLRKCGE